MRSRNVMNRPILKSDKSCISNPKSEISNWRGSARAQAVRSQISDFGFEMQDLSDFKILPGLSSRLRLMLCCLLVLAWNAPNLFSYSVLTHEAVVDSVWMETIEPMLRQ